MPTGTSVPLADYLNPLGSYYEAIASSSTTNLIRDAIFYAIYDLAPKQYDALKILNMAPTVSVKLDEFYYKEKVFSREALTVFSWSNPTITLTGTYTLEADIPVTVNSIITSPAGTPYIVIALTHSASANSSTINVAVQTGASALGAGTFSGTDVLGIQSKIIADGMDSFANPDKVRLVERYNYIQLFQRTQKWARIEYQKLINAATTDLMNHEKIEKLTQLRYDLFSTYFNGTRGEFNVIETSGNKKAKAMGGLYTLMVAGGSEHATVSLSGLQTAFEELGFSTNYKAVGGVRMIYATDQMLYEISKLYKEPGIRYTPNDKVADLNLTLYKIGSMNFVPVPCELFKETGVLPASWANKIIVLDQATVNRVVMQGIPPEEVGETLNKQQGAFYDYKIWWAAAQQSLKINNVMGSFYIDVS